jgi:hypothetical protein
MKNSRVNPRPGWIFVSMSMVCDTVGYFQLKLKVIDIRRLYAVLKRKRMVSYGDQRIIRSARAVVPEAAHRAEDQAADAGGQVRDLSLTPCGRLNGGV